MTKIAAHNVNELLSITDALNPRDAAVFGIEHQNTRELYMGTVRAWFADIENFDAATIEAVEYAGSKVSELRARAQTARLILGANPLGETAQNIFAICGQLSFCLAGMRDMLAAGNTDAAREDHAVLMTGFYLDGSEV